MRAGLSYVLADVQTPSLRTETPPPPSRFDELTSQVQCKLSGLVLGTHFISSSFDSPAHAPNANSNGLVLKCPYPPPLCNTPRHRWCLDGNGRRNRDLAKRTKQNQPGTRTSTLTEPQFQLARTNGTARAQTQNNAVSSPRRGSQLGWTTDLTMYHGV